MDCKFQPVHAGLQPLVNQQQVLPITAERSTKRGKVGSISAVGAPVRRGCRGGKGKPP